MARAKDQKHIAAGRRSRLHPASLPPPVLQWHSPDDLPALEAPMTLATPELVLRSLDATWTYARWEALPDDGNRYEVIAGVLYMTTAPSFFHQWIVQRLIRLVGFPAEDQGLAYFVSAPVGVLMPGCDPVQPDFLLVR